MNKHDGSTSWPFSSFVPLWLPLLFLAFATPCMAEVKVAEVFADHMVLQQQKPIPVWGTADAGETVTVKVAGQLHETKADAAGQWRVTLTPLAAADYPQAIEMKVNDTTLTDILVGEVWLCSGQSNMAWPAYGAVNSAPEIAAADYPKIRLFTVSRGGAAEPQDDLGKVITWSLCNPQTIRNFSAVGFFFGRDLHFALNVPVGLISSSVGGTPIEPWTSRAKLTPMSQATALIANIERSVANRDALMAKYNERLVAYKAEVERAKEAKETPTLRRPRVPADWTSAHAPGSLFNQMIHPLIPFAMRGAIWYQGESNVGRAYAYRALMPALIEDWRQRWGQGDFHFGIVQLANLLAIKDQPSESVWAELREAQDMTARNMTNVGLATAVDIGEAKNIHPKNKQDVSKRLALWAKATAYGQKVVYSGPRYRDVTFADSKATIQFDFADGLQVKGDALQGFAIAGADKQFVWADAKIDGDSVIVSSDKVTEPVAVRYAWADNPATTLYNSADLPALPFRTDDWPGLTAKSE